MSLVHGEQIVWRSVGDGVPDTDITVLLFMPSADVKVWPGYWGRGQWFLADGAIPPPVDAWAFMPAGPNAA